MSGIADDRRGVQPGIGFGFIPMVPKGPGSIDPQTTSIGRWQKPLTPQEESLARAFEAALMRSVPTFEAAPHQAVPFRGDMWIQDAGLGVIVNAVSSAGDSTASTVSDATGASFTESASNRDAVIVSRRVPDQKWALVDYVQIRVADDLGFRRLEFTLELGGGRSLALNARNALFQRDGTIPIRKLVQPAKLIRLLATNNSTESAHLVEAIVVGWEFPIAMLSDSLKGLIQNESSR